MKILQEDKYYALRKDVSKPAHYSAMNESRPCNSMKVYVESIDIGNNKSSDPTYEHYSFRYQGIDYSYSICGSDYKAASCRNKEYINSIHPYDNTEYCWAVRRVGEREWKIIYDNKAIDVVDGDIEDAVKALQEYDKNKKPQIDRT